MKWFSGEGKNTVLQCLDSNQRKTYEKMEHPQGK